ncbi:MAG: T9SS type A sorting domain-containing protein, partial [Ignavibacteriaceae bacterium]
MKKVLLLILIYALNVNAQLTFQPTYNLSNTPSATSDYHSVYSFDMFYYVVWGDNGEIKFKSSSNWGETWSANVTVSNTQSTCGWPVVTAGSHQDIFVLYHTIAGGGNYEVIFQKTTNGGLSWSPMQKISGAASAITPQLVLVGYTLYAVWEERPNNNYEIYFSKYSIINNTWTAPQNISNTATTSRWVQLQADGQDLYCAWIETTTYPLSDIYFTKSTDGGTNWTNPVNITNDDRPQNRICMTLNSAGKIYIASDDIITFNFDEIYLLSSSDSGSTWSSAVNITNNPGNSNTPWIQAFGDFIYFTWSDNTHSAPAYDNSDIFFKWSSDGGVTWQDSINLSENPETSSRPRICYGWDGPIGDPYLRLTTLWYDYSLGAAEILARNGVHQIIPVELVSFRAEVVNQNIHLNWITASELNNSGFEVQRQVNIMQSGIGNMQWEMIGFVEGNGTTTETNHYSFTDKIISAGKYVYRLKQIDFDGSIEYSDIVEVETAPAVFQLSQNYPNPFNPSTKISWQSPVSSWQTLKVYDLLGREVATLVDEYKPAGSYEVEFDASGLSSGIYYYRLSAEPSACRPTGRPSVTGTHCRCRRRFVGA